MNPSESEPLSCARDHERTRVMLDLNGHSLMWYYVLVVEHTMIIMIVREKHIHYNMNNTSCVEFHLRLGQNPPSWQSAYTGLLGYVNATIYMSSA